jgi:hypothetical protein
MQRIMRWVLGFHPDGFGSPFSGLRPVLSALLSPTETPTSIPTQVQSTPTANILFPYDASVLVFPKGRPSGIPGGGFDPVQ